MATVALGLALSLGAETSASACRLIVESATWGARNPVDVTLLLKERCDFRSLCSFDVDAAWLGTGDAAAGRVLTVRARPDYPGDSSRFAFREGETGRYLDCRASKSGRGADWVVRGAGD